MNTSPQLRASMMYGTYSGLSSFLLFIIIYVIGKNPLGALSLMGFWIPILFIILGIQNHRDKDLEGFISYGRALGTGVLITLFLAILFSVLAYAFLTFVATGILEVHKAEMIEGMDRVKKIFGESINDKVLEEIENITFGKIAFGDFQNKVSGGVLTSLIVAAFLRKSKPIFDQPIQ